MLWQYSHLRTLEESVFQWDAAFFYIKDYNDKLFLLLYNGLITKECIMDRKDFEENYKIIKALSDVNRVLIINYLSKGELCACKILEKFDITQPTLSYHMKMLSACGLVNSRKEGKWIHYSLNMDKIKQFQDFISNLTSS